MGRSGLRLRERLDGIRPIGALSRYSSVLYLDATMVGKMINSSKHRWGMSRQLTGGA